MVLHTIRKFSALFHNHPKRSRVTVSHKIGKTIHLKSRILLILLFCSVQMNLIAQNNDSIALFMQQFEYLKALDKINRMDKNGSDLQLLDLKATALKGLNRYLEAIPVYKRSLENDSADLRNITSLANCYQSIGDYKNAQQFYKKALKLSPDNNYLYQQLADACFMDDAFESAFSNYFTAYTADSSYYLSKQIARCFDNLGKSDTAIYYYRKANALNPVDFQTAYRLANLYKQNKDYPSAILVTDSFLNNDSTNMKMLKLSGYLNFLNKDYPAAILSFKKCISLSDTSDFTCKYLGYSYFKEKEFELAKDYLEKAFQKDTTNVELCYTLGLSCDYSVYKKLGIEYLGKTIELATPSPIFLSQVYQDLAAANTGYYKYEEALQCYLKAYELNPSDTILIFKIAGHYDNWIKDKNNALKYYQVFMATRPEHKKPLPKMPLSGGIVVSYYDYVERRMGEIKEELFWQGKTPETPSTEKK